MGLGFGGDLQLARASGNGEAKSQGAPVQLVETQPGCDSGDGKELSKEEAKAAFKQGRAAFDAGDYQTAITHWKQSYADDCTAHALLYNIALAYEGLDDASQAVVFHKAYLDRQKDAADREQVLQRIESLERQIAENEGEKSATSQQTTSEPTVEQTATDGGPTQPNTQGSGSVKPVNMQDVSTKSDESSHPAPIAPWVMVGVGGAVMVASGVLLGIGANDVSDAEAKCPNRKCESGSKTIQEGNTGLTMMMVGGLGLGVGAVAVVGGLTWYFVAKPSSNGRRAATTVYPTVGRGFIGLGVSGSL